MTLKEFISVSTFHSTSLQLPALGRNGVEQKLPRQVHLITVGEKCLRV